MYEGGIETLAITEAFGEFRLEQLMALFIIYSYDFLYFTKF